MSQTCAQVHQGMLDSLRREVPIYDEQITELKKMK